MTLRFSVRSHLCLLFSDPETGEPRYGFEFAVVATTPSGRRFEHFYRETDRTDRVPARIWRLLHRIRRTRLSKLSASRWRETYPAPRSRAGRAMAEDMARIARAEDERDNRFTLRTQAA